MASGGGPSSGLLCICRPPAALLPATAERGSAASGEMGGGMSGGLRFIPMMATRRVRPEDGETAGRPGVRGGAEGIEGEVEGGAAAAMLSEARWGIARMEEAAWREERGWRLVLC
jgi:hypothetical protein